MSAFAFYLKRGLSPEAGFCRADMIKDNILLASELKLYLSDKMGKDNRIHHNPCFFNFTEETRYLIHTFGRDKYNQYFQDELPRHKVCLDGFWMGKTEVTRGQFKKFIAARNYQTDAEISGSAWTYNKSTGRSWEKVSGCTWENPGMDQTDAHPVTAVTAFFHSPGRQFQAQ